jgi:hypothetical protein
MLPEHRLTGGDSEVGLDLLSLADDVRRFLLLHSWCTGIRALYYDRGFPKVAVFLANIDSNGLADPQVWVIVGDVPPMYLDTMDQINGAEALLAYTFVYRTLLDAYSRNEPLTNLPPLVTSRSFHEMILNADVVKMLTSRLEFIEKLVDEYWSGEVRDELKEIIENGNE